MCMRIWHRYLHLLLEVEEETAEGVEETGNMGSQRLGRFRRICVCFEESETGINDI